MSETQLAINRARVAVATLTLSAAGFLGWLAYEGDGPVTVDHGVEMLHPYIPTKGDAPTIGHGATHYEDGKPVTLEDAPITRERADALALNLLHGDEKAFAQSLPGVKLYPQEYDLYLDFVGQYGITNWRNSSMRRLLLAGDYKAACDALLRYRFAAGFDCSTPGNKRCMGVWTRQQERHAKCLAAQ